MKQLSICKLAVRNLMHRRVRTTFLAAFVLILSASLLASNVLTASMEECIDKTVDRIGADVIVAPKEFSSELSDSLFAGERCSFYFDRSYIEEVEKIEGIETISPQLYVATLDASCCSVPVQIVAFEPETDFIVQPWLSGAGVDRLEKGQVVVGSKITSSPGDTISFFGFEYDVAGKLEETETSYDNCAFMNFDTAYTLFESNQMKYVSDISNPEQVVSLLMIRAREGAEPSEIADGVNKDMKDSGLQAFTASGLFDDVSGTLNQLQSYSTLLIGLLFLMAVLALVCVFNITVNERHREFGILMSVGTQKGNIFKMLLLEAGIIGLLGGILGILISGGGILLFSDVITEKMNIPYLISDVKDYLLLAFRCLILSAATSMLSTLYASAKASRMEPFRLIQEVDR
ncbi:MAG: ABC transporter permease [Anaerobutyricum hallii]|uniref:ABC transporter permease n=1 Tax=Anaerobutyricum hallii TaxID=39488 RepID=UPI002A82D47D|nr:ABC transporter permease [Anaerobutyricum hallii]MDY4579047.1 ABC transporter permease [Anaerobutyricum hallii]